MPRNFYICFHVPRSKLSFWEEARDFFKSQAAEQGVSFGSLATLVLLDTDKFLSGGGSLPPLPPAPPYGYTGLHKLAAIASPVGWKTQGEEALRKLRLLASVYDATPWQVFAALAAYYKEHPDELPRQS